MHLVAPVFDASGMRDEDAYLGDFAYGPESISNIENVCDQIFLYHSTDDPVVPYAHAEKIQSYLPHAKLIRYSDKGHFSEESTFPAILEHIRKN